MNFYDWLVSFATQVALLATIWPELPLCPKAVGGWLRQTYCPTFFIL